MTPNEVEEVGETKANIVPSEIKVTSLNELTDVRELTPIERRVSFKTYMLLIYYFLIRVICQRDKLLVYLTFR